MHRLFLFLYILFCVSSVFAQISSDTKLNHLFYACYINKSHPQEILNNTYFKEQILNRYSKDYYNKIIENGKLFSNVTFDSYYKCYRLYIWKNRKYEYDNCVKIRYYINKDSLSATLNVNALEIGKSGDCTNWENNIEDNLALINLLALAKDGRALAAIAIRCAKGIKCEKNPQNVKIWLEKAAQQDYSDAQFLLGIMESEQENLSKSIMWLQKAAEQDNILALRTLANIYIEGKLVPKDSTTSIKYLQHGALFNTNFQHTLGLMYWNGQFAKQNKSLGLQYLTLAAENGLTEAMLELAFIYMDGTGLEKNLSKSLNWITKAAECGNDDAQYLLARIYMQNELPLVIEDYPSKKTLKAMASPNINLGLKWLKKSAEQGHTSAQRCLGAYYYKKEHNKVEARKWLEKSGDDLILLFPDLYH